jgi:hypothetical protein
MQCGSQQEQEGVDFTFECAPFSDPPDSNPLVSDPPALDLSPFLSLVCQSDEQCTSILPDSKFPKCASYEFSSATESASFNLCADLTKCFTTESLSTIEQNIDCKLSPEEMNEFLTAIPTCSKDS